MDFFLQNIKNLEERVHGFTTIDEWSMRVKELYDSRWRHTQADVDTLRHHMEQVGYISDFFDKMDTFYKHKAAVHLISLLNHQVQFGVHTNHITYYQIVLDVDDISDSLVITIPNMCVVRKQLGTKELRVDSLRLDAPLPHTKSLLVVLDMLAQFTDSNRIIIDRVFESYMCNLTTDTLVPGVLKYLAGVKCNIESFRYAFSSNEPVDFYQQRAKQTLSDLCKDTETDLEWVYTLPITLAKEPRHRQFEIYHAGPKQSPVLKGNHPLKERVIVLIDVKDKEFLR